MSREQPPHRDDIDYLKREFTILATLVDRFDVAIDRLSDVSRSVDKMLAVHETRLETQEKTAELLEKKITELRDDIVKKIDSNNTAVNTSLSDTNKRIAHLERWKWVVAGVISAATFVLTYFDPIAKLVARFTL